MLSRNQTSTSLHALPATGSTVVVTGASGFVGSWLTKLLIERGHTVRACVRNLGNEHKVAFLAAMQPASHGRLTLHAADMTVEGAYDQIFEGVHTVFHPAEVFMSFGSGRDAKRAAADFGTAAKVTAVDLNTNAMRSSQFIVDSINRSSSVKRLIYTASIASCMPANMKEYERDPVIDEFREPNATFSGAHSYGVTKRTTEHFLTYQAAISQGRWSVVIANPADIVGPVLSAHQAPETWQGKIGLVVAGGVAPQEPLGRPYMLVDVRDVAEAEIRLAESGAESGSRHIITSGDKLYPEEIGPSLMALFTEWDCTTTCGPEPRKKAVHSPLPIWRRVHLRNDKARRAVGMSFIPFEETLKATAEALVKVGGVVPRLK